jgi:adenylate cyclase
VTDTSNRAIGSAHLWSERFDRELRDVLALQAEVSESIQRELSAQVQGFVGAEPRARWRGSTQDIHAYDHLRRGYELVMTLRHHDVVVEVRRHLQRALEIDPSYATAYAQLGATYWLEFGLVWSTDPISSTRSGPAST